MADFVSLTSESRTLQGFLEMQFEDDPQIIVERGNCISAWLARSTVMLADAKRLLNQSKTSEIAKLITTTFAENKLSAQAQNQMLNAICSEEQYLVDLLTEQNKTLKHQLDWCRSIISKYKTELSSSGIGREYNS